MERLYRKRVPADEIVSVDIARTSIIISKEIGRQIGLLISRTGIIEYIIVGDEKSIFIPEIKDFPLGKRPLRGLRLIHTHLKGEPLNDDDLNDLSLLRFDLIAALDASDNFPTAISMSFANLLSPSTSTLPYLIHQHLLVSINTPNFASLIESLEIELQNSFLATKDVNISKERAILISVSSDSKEDTVDSMEELKELARTANVAVLDCFIQRTKRISPRFLMGEGKIRDVVIRALQIGASILIFDQELSPAQVRSISNMTELKVIDRSQLILDIFARRATSLDGKVQVELAQLKYLLPRLVGHGVQMSRLMGGIGGRGPGETKLELDRRRIHDRISKLERELKVLADGRFQRRQKRIKSGLPIISIIGYTNAGKSTLLNTLTQSSVFTENLLFATLDTSTRRLRFPREREVIITDTVGFIRSIPKSLLGAFKATLEELQDANLLLHVVDCSNPRFFEQIKQVENILSELDLSNKERVLVFNKTDKLNELKSKSPLIFMKVKHAAHKLNAIQVSATDKNSLTPLMIKLQTRFWLNSDTADH